MTVTREQFEQGMSYAEYKAQMTRNLERMQENEASITLDSEDVRYFAQLPQAINALVLAEDWCGDVVANLPVLANLADKSGKINVRIFLRDQNLDLMEHYLKDGQFRSIPVFAFFDENFQPLGHWIERPASVSQRQGKMMADLYATDAAMKGVEPGTSPAQMPDAARARLMQAFTEFRAQNRDFANSEVVREIKALVSQGLNEKESVA